MSAMTNEIYYCECDCKCYGECYTVEFTEDFDMCDSCNCHDYAFPDEEDETFPNGIENQKIIVGV